MGNYNLSCKCLKTCKDINEEYNLSQSDYLRNKTQILKINNDPKRLTKFPQNNLTFNTDKSERTNKTEKKYNKIQYKIIEEDDQKNNIETNNNEMNIPNNNDKKETEKEQEKEEGKEELEKEEKDKNKESTENNENKNNKENNRNKGKEEDNLEDNKNKSFQNNINKENKNKFENNEFYRLNSVSTIKFISTFDKNIFFTDKLKKAEKNFEHPINYEKDWSQYLESPDKEDMLKLIETMNSNKGENHTKKEGQVIEQKGKQFLYIGELDKNQIPRGFGVLYTSQGEKYEGNFLRGKLIGIGRYIDVNGTCYEGIFKFNKLISKAKIIKRSEKDKKLTYFGETHNLKKNGKGEEIYEGEYRYIGEFVDDLKEGHGKIEYFETGEIYEGEFKKGEIIG